LTTAYQIGLNWSPGSYDGGSPLLDYRVNYMPLSGSSYSVFASNITTILFVVTGLVPGITYKFVVQSRNLVNYSDYSESVTILAAQIPDKPTDL